MARKTYELQLPYYKQGDDLHFFLEKVNESKCANPSAEAFTAHAAMLEEAAERLKHMAKMAIEHGLTIEGADVHFIAVECEEELGNSLCAEERLSVSPFDDEDDEDAESDEESDQDLDELESDDESE